MLYGGEIFKNEDYRKEGLRKESADNTYKSMTGTIFKNGGLRPGISTLTPDHREPDSSAI